MNKQENIREQTQERRDGTAAKQKTAQTQERRGGTAAKDGTEPSKAAE